MKNKNLHKKINMKRTFSFPTQEIGLSVKSKTLTFYYSMNEFKSNEIFVHFVEFLNMNNNDRSYEKKHHPIFCRIAERSMRENFDIFCCGSKTYPMFEKS